MQADSRAQHGATPEEGATMVEYGFLLAGIAIACTVAVNLFGASIGALFGPVTGMFP